MGEARKSVRLEGESRRVVEALLDTIIPSEGGERPGALDVNMGDQLLEWLGQFPGSPRLFVIVCWMWEFSPIWSGRLARFSRLSFEERTRVLEGFEGSGLLLKRGALLVFKSVVLAAFYANPEIWPLLGYREGCLSQPPNPIPH